MPITDDLLQEIAQTLDAGVKPSLTTASAASDLFEAYIFTLVVQAAEAEGASVNYRDVNGNSASTLIFRTSPGHLFSRTQAYGHAVITFSGKEPLEAHVGVRVSGKSRVLHELDVCVITQAEADTSRLNLVPPRSKFLILGIECKFYTTRIGLGLARAFIGLDTDMSTKAMFFVTSTSSGSVERLLTARGRNWDSSVLPSFSIQVERLRNQFQTVFKNYKAR